MTSLEKLGNGFKIKERFLEDSNKVDLKVEILKDGLFVESKKFEEISMKEEENIIANYLATQMQLFGAEEGTVFEERVRLAKKAMSLHIVNGYKIIPLKENKHSDVEVQLLESGKFSKSTYMHGLTPEKLAELQKKLNGIIKYQLDIKIQSRPLYGIEIITMIN